MKDSYFTDQDFSIIDFNEKPLAKGEYENCTFKFCNFEYANLSGFSFNDCEFVGCNLSMVNVERTAFRNARFKDCKMIGINFSECNDFGLVFTFDECILNNSTFYKKGIKRSIFKNSKLVEVDFEETDLSHSIISNCDLSGATFEQTNLEHTDFRTSFNYSIKPAQNKLKRTKFSQSEIHGLLDQYDIEIEKN